MINSGACLHPTSQLIWLMEGMLGNLEQNRVVINKTLPVLRTKHNQNWSVWNDAWLCYREKWNWNDTRELFPLTRSGKQWDIRNLLCAHKVTVQPWGQRLAVSISVHKHTSPLTKHPCILVWMRSLIYRGGVRHCSSPSKEAGATVGSE